MQSDNPGRTQRGLLFAAMEPSPELEEEFHRALPGEARHAGVPDGRTLRLHRWMAALPRHV